MHQIKLLENFGFLSCKPNILITQSILSLKCTDNIKMLEYFYEKRFITKETISNKLVEKCLKNQSITFIDTLNGYELM